MAGILTPELLKAVVALFIIVDPLGNVPIFISLTSKMAVEERRRAFHTATIAAFTLLLIFAVAGQQGFKHLRYIPFNLYGRG